MLFGHLRDSESGVQVVDWMSGRCQARAGGPQYKGGCGCGRKVTAQQRCGGWLGGCGIIKATTPLGACLLDTSYALVLGQT